MDECKTVYHWDDLPFKLDEEIWGALREVAEAAPGVYSVYMDPKPGEHLGRELYAVSEEAVPAVISKEVADRGTEVEGARVFVYEGAESLYNLVEYEVMRYCAKEGRPFREDRGSLYCAAVYNGEFFPWYFGGTIPPRDTPFGLTVRVKKADEGLFFLETDQCRWVLAVSYPIWNAELSAPVRRLGAFCGDTLSLRAEESRYLFFPVEHCANAVYELWESSDHTGLRQFVRSKQSLEEHIRCCEAREGEDFLLLP